MMKYIFWAVVLGLLVSSCTSYDNDSDKPMPTIQYPIQAGVQASNLCIMLPGLHNSPTVFSANGLVAIAQKNIQADVVAVDASLKYYIDRSIVNRLLREIIEPARAKGYKHIWLVGSSMGGFGCLLSAQNNPEYIDGLILLAPFLGEGGLEKELMQVGGLTNWKYEVGSGKDEQDRKVREIWYWLQQYYANSVQKPQIWLACGNSDKFSTDAKRLSAVMPMDHTLFIDGKHDWKTWSALFSGITERDNFRQGLVRNGSSPGK